MNASSTAIDPRIGQLMRRGKIIFYIIDVWSDSRAKCKTIERSSLFEIHRELIIREPDTQYPDVFICDTEGRR